MCRWFGEGLYDEKRASGLGYPAPIELTSGAFHDAMYVAERTPTAMIFVPSHQGISHNAATPSLATLHRLAVTLNTNISDLMSEETPSNGPIMRQGQRQVINSGDIDLEHITFPRRNGLLQANIHIVPEGCASDGMIEHQGEEVGYVLQGKLELTLGEQKHILEPGDAFTFNSQTPHGYKNIGSGELKVLWVNTPATF